MLSSMNSDFLISFCDRLFGGSFDNSLPPDKIPCIETSDKERLCKSPLVSVRVVTYNQEKYIGECLDGILKQVTDFEYEIVIGEDCSQDRTREICFEYQKRHPNKIRVLWWHENVREMGGNQARTQAHCRGEYIALLEGDDYWTDPLKLQKQVDLIRLKKCIGCVANYAILNQSGELHETRYRSNGVISHQDLAHFYPHTSTYVIRRDFLEERSKLFPDIHAWYDVIFVHCLVEIGKVAHLEDVVSVYRQTGTGIATGLSGQKKILLGIKQYLDLYLNGPKSWHKRFGALVLTYIAFFFNRSTSGWTQGFTEDYAHDLKRAFWNIYMCQPFDLRAIRALMRYMRFAKIGGAMKSEPLKLFIGEFLRYIVVGGIAFMADFVTLVGSQELFFHRYAGGVYWATVMGFVVGLAVNYFLSLLFVFTSAKDKGKGRSVGAFIIFGVVGLLGLGWTELGMWVGISCLKLNYMFVKILVTGVVLMWNYLGRKILVFGRKERR